MFYQSHTGLGVRVVESSTIYKSYLHVKSGLPACIRLTCMPPPDATAVVTSYLGVTMFGVSSLQKAWLSLGFPT